MGAPSPSQVPAASTVVPPDPPTEPGTLERVGPDAKSDSASARAGLAGKYLIVGLIGQGGMGQVFRVHDPTFGRPLAIKVLRSEHRKGFTETRFLEEARITGQLQHPGIPPVHEIGNLDDGRPFLAMKLIEGHTLAELLKARRSPDQSLSHFLGIFHLVCQTLAYAHSRGVIHRDLKPANVMVGEFGEVQVMDWGLAKQLRAVSEVAAPDAQSTIRSRHPHGTMVGTVVGTPAFMPPEQARGEIEQLDERSDVFGLGAILCVLLTGEPPYCGTDNREILSTAEMGDVEHAVARLERCGADRELIDLAQRCLSPVQVERPANAGEVATAVGAYLNGVQERLRTAEMEQARAEVRRAEERKRRRLARALAVAVLALAVLGGASAWWFERRESERRADEARHAERVRLGVGSSIEQAARLRERWLYAPAEKVLDEAATLLATDGPDGLRDQLAQARRDVRFAQRLDELRQERLVLYDGGDFNKQRSREQYQQEFRDRGFDILNGDMDDLLQRIRASDVREAIAATLDDWLFLEFDRPAWKRLWDLTARLNPRDRCRQLPSSSTPEEIRDQADPSQTSAGFLVGLVGVLRSTGNLLELLEQSCERYPSDIWLQFYTGSALHYFKRQKASLAHFEAARTLRPDSAILASTLGHLRLLNKDVAGAVLACRRAVDLNPDSAITQSNLALSLAHAKDFPAAITACRAAIKLNPKFVNAHCNLGFILMETKDYPGAIAACRKAVEIDPRLSRAHHNLGAALGRSGVRKEAVKSFRRAIELDATEPGPFKLLGLTLSELNDKPGAIAALRSAIALDGQDPETHFVLGAALIESDNQKAVVAFRNAVALNPAFHEARCCLGTTLINQGEFVEAREELRKYLLQPKGDPTTRSNADFLIRAAGQLIIADDKLSDILQNRAEPKDAKEMMNLAILCRQYRKRYAAAARFYSQAFAADGQCAKSGSARHHAAQAAVLAAAGQGIDADNLKEPERARLRKQALEWLRADLTALADQLAQPAQRKSAHEKLSVWTVDPQFAPVRGFSALANLPEAERGEWRALWEEVAALLRQSGSSR